MKDFPSFSDFKATLTDEKLAEAFSESPQLHIIQLKDLRDERHLTNYMRRWSKQL